PRVAQAQIAALMRRREALQGPQLLAGYAPLSAGPDIPEPTSNPQSKDQIKEAEARAKKIQDVIAALELERDNLSRTSEQQAIYNALAKAGVDINSQAGQRIAEIVRESESLKAAKEGLADKTKRELAAVKEAEQAKIAYQKELNARIGPQRQIVERVNDEIANNEALIAALR